MLTAPYADWLIVCLCQRLRRDSIHGNTMHTSTLRAAGGSIAVTIPQAHSRQFATRQAAQSEVMDWLAFHNATRLHSTLGYVSPMKFEKNWLAAQERQSA